MVLQFCPVRQFDGAGMTTCMVSSERPSFGGFQGREKGALGWSQENETRRKVGMNA